jgi:putative effector of murein hydrolase LrgA (UPF0299 family)
MKILFEEIAKIPLPRLVVGTLLLLLFLAAMQQLTWAHSVVEHLLNMEGTPR